MNQSSDASPQRDAASLRILGNFFVILGALVLLGTCWTLDDVRASIVNVCSGLVLASVGAGMLLIARRLAAADTPATNPNESPCKETQ